MRARLAAWRRHRNDRWRMRRGYSIVAGCWICPQPAAESCGSTQGDPTRGSTS